VAVNFKIFGVPYVMRVDIACLCGWRHVHGFSSTCRL